MFLAQYKVLRANGHSPSEAFNETVEEATQSLFPLIGEKGMDYMYNACSTTARRGALDWAPIFEAANRPVFEKLYESVKNGTETSKSLEFNGRKTYREDLARELKEIDEQEIWVAGTSNSLFLIVVQFLTDLCRQDRPFFETRCQASVISYTTIQKGIHAETLRSSRF